MPNKEYNPEKPPKSSPAETLQTVAESLERFGRISESIGRDLVVRDERFRSAIEAMSNPIGKSAGIQAVLSSGRLFENIVASSEMSQRRLKKFNEALETLQSQKFSRFQDFVKNQEQVFRNASAAISRMSSAFENLDHERISAILEAAYVEADTVLPEVEAESQVELADEEKILVLVMVWVVNTSRSVGILETDSIISILVAVVLTLYSIQSSQEDVSDINARLDSLVESVESLGTIPLGHIVVVTASELNLRNGPNLTAEIEMVLKEGSEAEVLRSEGVWLYLKYRDSGSKEDHYGWSHAAYTRSKD